MAIHDLTQQIAQAHEDLDDAVSAARDSGVSWEIIADAAGIAEQSARRRWAGPAH